jgi:RimJ/RimL family protein N-acetyltransferase
MTESTTATSPDTTQNGQEQPKPKGWEGQTFLVGEEVYVRGIEEGDAKAVTAWRNSLFPASTARAETIIKEDIPKEGDQRKNTMILVRKSDDRVVGAVVVRGSFWSPATWVTVRIDPLIGNAATLAADAIALVIPWLAEENQKAVIRIELADDQTEEIAAAEKIGMQRVARYREAFWRMGQRHDSFIYEYLNPQWIANLGDPNEVALERSGTGLARPVIPSVTPDGDPPPQAVMVGPRVYLRATQKEDAELMARWSRQETEPFWSAGRFVDSPVGIQHWIQEEQKADLPRGVNWTVCLRENDEPIGMVGIGDIDYIHRNGETGSWIGRPEYRGGGYGSEAKNLLLEWCFTRLNLHMIRSHVIFPNTRSAAALRKQGYQEAGRYNWDFNLNGTYGNAVVFDLLAEEWRALPRA